MDCDTQEKSDENMRVANEAVAALFRMKTPTIAMVNGAAAGAGFNLALACDMIFAAEKAKFIQSFVNVGIASDCGGHYLLEKAVGRHLAKELMFTARPVTAQEGKELGFVNRIYPGGQLMDETLAFAAEIAKKAPLALAATKQLLNRAEEMSLEEVLEAEKQQQGPLLLSHDCERGHRGVPGEARGGLHRCLRFRVCGFVPGSRSRSSRKNCSGNWAVRCRDFRCSGVPWMRGRRRT